MKSKWKDGEMIEEQAIIEQTVEKTKTSYKSKNSYNTAVKRGDSGDN